MIESPVALNSMVFRLSSIAELYKKYEVNMYIAKRFHMESIKADYYDFENKKPMHKAQVFNF